MDARTTLPLPDTCDTAPRRIPARPARRRAGDDRFHSFALVLGAQAAQKGLSALEVPLMTGLNFAGGSSSPPSNCGPRHRTSH
jgi:hypothetical protein